MKVVYRKGNQKLCVYPGDARVITSLQMWPRASAKCHLVLSEGLGNWGRLSLITINGTYWEGRKHLWYQHLCLFSASLLNLCPVWNILSTGLYLSTQLCSSRPRTNATFSVGTKGLGMSYNMGTFAQPTRIPGFNTHHCKEKRKTVVTSPTKKCHPYPPIPMRECVHCTGQRVYCLLLLLKLSPHKLSPWMSWPLPST